MYLGSQSWFCHEMIVFPWILDPFKLFIVGSCGSWTLFFAAVRLPIAVGNCIRNKISVPSRSLQQKAWPTAAGKCHGPGQAPLDSARRSEYQLDQ